MYGFWKKIGISGLEKADEKKHDDPVPPPQQTPPSPDVDDDLKELDRILQSAPSSAGHGSSPEKTFEEDVSLEALEKLIAQIKKKGSEDQSQEKPAPKESKKTEPYDDVMSLLSEDDRFDLDSIEEQLLGEKPKKKSADTLEGIEDEYLRILEQRYEQEKGKGRP